MVVKIRFLLVLSIMTKLPVPGKPQVISTVVNSAEAKSCTHILVRKKDNFQAEKVEKKDQSRSMLDTVKRVRHQVLTHPDEDSKVLL